MNDYNIEVLNLNNYITPVVDIHGKKFITNGILNETLNISKIDITESNKCRL
jgi:hypothetical protein